MKGAKYFVILNKNQHLLVMLVCARQLRFSKSCLQKTLDWMKDTKETCQVILFFPFIVAPTAE